MDDEKPTVFEELGYRRDNMQGEKPYHMERKRPVVEKKRIRLLSGDFKGECRLYRVDIADELIANGKAVVVQNKEE